MERILERGRILILCGALGLAAFWRPPPARADERLTPPVPRPPGVTAEVERAIERGIEYLLSVRHRDVGARQSYWGMSGASYQGRRARNRSDGEVYRCAMTALVGLGLLANGNTPTRGPHAEAVDEITEFLLACSQDNGLITSGYDEERPMYSHAFAMTFLAQVFGQEANPTRRERIRKVLHKAVSLTAKSQTDDGGWGYVPNYFADEGTLTVTQLQGLRACRDAGIAVPKGIIERGVKFIKDSSNDDGSVRYRVNDTRIRPGVTCAAVVALWNAGEFDSELFKRIADRVNADIEHDWRNTHHAEYVAYFLSQAKWVQGGGFWERYYRDATAQLVRDQRADGAWMGPEMGEVYSSAIALLILQLPYSRVPVYQR
jgi:hypothetical protein